MRRGDSNSVAISESMKNDQRVANLREVGELTGHTKEPFAQRTLMLQKRLEKIWLTLGLRSQSTLLVHSD